MYTSRLRLQTLDCCNSNSLIWVRFEKSHSHCCLQSDVFQQWLLLPKQLVSCLFANATISCFLSHSDTDRITNRMTLANSVSTARQWFIVVGRAPCLVSTMSDKFYLLSGREWRNFNTWDWRVRAITTCLFNSCYNNIMLLNLWVLIFMIQG